MPTDERGIYRKFDVRRVDCSDHPGGKHHGCTYFVLDLHHDEHAADALAAYVESCREKRPMLAAELTHVIDALRRRGGPRHQCVQKALDAFAEERARGVVDECCRGANPACAGGCLVERAARGRERDDIQREREKLVLLDRLCAERSATRERIASLENMLRVVGDGQARAEAHVDDLSAAIAKLQREREDAVVAFAREVVRRARDDHDRKVLIYAVADDLDRLAGREVGETLRRVRGA